MGFRRGVFWALSATGHKMYGYFMIFFLLLLDSRGLGSRVGPLRLKGGSVSWSDSSVTQRLRDLAKSPYDLTVNDAITPSRISSMQVRND